MDGDASDVDERCCKANTTCGNGGVLGGALRTNGSNATTAGEGSTSADSNEVINYLIASLNKNDPRSTRERSKTKKTTF